VRILFLDIASHDGLLACVTETGVVQSVSFDHRIDDGELAAFLTKALREARWALSTLTHIACTTGPGGFTSLRVGIATANALAHQLSVPIAGVGLWELYRARCSLEDAHWIHSTKRSSVFFRSVGDSSGPSHLSLEDLRARLQPGECWMGELIPDHRSLVEDVGLAEVVLRPLDEILPTFLARQHYAQQILTPWYGRGW
jgi:tRNA threonylcarbamoyl adenosine modification protein YeaZ